MKKSTVALILLLEGLASSGLQMLTIRQVTAHIGSSVLVTSIVVSTFLAALALGYYIGGRSASQRYRTMLVRNLVISIGIFGIGISYPAVDLFFTQADALTLGTGLLHHPLVHLFAYSWLVLAPLVFFLAQTVPLLLHTSASDTSKSEAAGTLTALSTVGNVMGCLLSALVLMVVFGVGTAIVVNCALLLIALLFMVDLKKRADWGAVSLGSVFLLIAGFLNVIVERQLFDATSEYANIKVVEHDNGRALLVNRQFASFTNDQQHAWPYVEVMRDALRAQPNLKTVAVLGAGGFTLTSDGGLDAHVTYVDVDSDLHAIAEAKFLKESIKGTFVAADARGFLLDRQTGFDAIVVDLFSSSVMIPAHTATREFFELVESRLNTNGIAIMNIAANPLLDDPYSVRIDATVRAAFDRCVTDLSGFNGGLENIVYFCRPSRTGINSEVAGVYQDDREGVSIDAFLLAQAEKERGAYGQK